jgi:hypothetical protein
MVKKAKKFRSKSEFFIKKNIYSFWIFIIHDRFESNLLSEFYHSIFGYVF